MYNPAGEKLEYRLHDADRDDVLAPSSATVSQDICRRPLYQGLAETLAGTGWPTLRFSFSGHGHSEGQFARNDSGKRSR